MADNRSRAFKGHVHGSVLLKKTLPNFEEPKTAQSGACSKMQQPDPQGNVCIRIVKVSEKVFPCYYE